MRSFFSALAAITLLAAPAAAQDQRVFVNLNFGSGAQNQDLRQTAEFVLYEEQGTWEANHAIEGGPFFDVGAGLRLTRNFGVGAAYTARTKQTRDVTVDARVPSPIFFDTLRSATGTVSGLEHSEQAVHLQALWHVPVTMEFGITLFGGPSFFTVRDELVESIAPVETGGDFSTVAIDNIGVSGQRNTATGFNVGIDGQYMFLRNAGVGAMLRYSRGSVDLITPGNSGPEQFTIDTGGLEIGAGLRFRF